MAILVGAFLGLLAFDFAGNASSGFDPMAVGLGKNTESSRAKLGEHFVSAIDNPLDLVPAIRAARLRGERVVLWLGASQLHSINHMKPGDILAVDRANSLNRARSGKTTYIQFSFPNSSFHSLLGNYLLLRREGVRPDALLMAMTYDDLREEAVATPLLRQLSKADFPVALRGRASDLLAWTESGEGAATGDDNDPLVRNATEGTMQERLESTVVESLGDAWPAYGQRQALHGLSRVMTVSVFHGLFGSFMSRRVPSVPDAMKAWNNLGLWALVDVALGDGAQVLMYEQPHLPEQNPFYHNRQKYDAWHQSLAEKAEADSGLYYADFETLVPAQYWGITNEGRPDCFHFRAEGHELLGQSIDGWLATIEELN